ncbi:MAG: PD-(D/E)XK nuclease family protein [Acidobacteriota bacterium]
MPCEFVLAPSFPLLLSELVERVRRSCQEDRLAPKWVVAPTATVANHVRVRLGQTAGTGIIAGVRVVPLLPFVRRFTSSPAGHRWGPDLDLSLSEMISQLPAGSPLSSLRSMSNGFRLLKPTFLDLAEGGFGLGQIELLEELAAEPDLSSVERETLLLYARWITILQHHEIAWEPLLQQELAEDVLKAEESALRSCLAAEAGRNPRVFFYGFYDFTDNNAQLVAALAGRLDISIFFPSGEQGRESHPVFSFCRQVQDDLTLRMGNRVELSHLGPAPHSSTQFFASTFMEGQVPDRPPDFLTFQTASGIQAEVLSAAVRIRRWLDDPESPIEPHEVLLIAPQAEIYLQNVREIFACFAIPLRVVDVPQGRTLQDRAFQALARIWEDQAPAEWVLDYLRNHPDLPVLHAIDMGVFESKVRRLGVWGGITWQSILEISRGKSESGEERDDVPQFSRQERVLVEEICALWVGGASTGPFTSREAADYLERIRAGWLEQAEFLDPLIQALRSTHLRSPGLRISGPLLREMLLSCGESRLHSDSLEQPGVVFGPLMRTRGLTGRAVVILGLASGALPFRVEEDPLLSDASRRRLIGKARDVGHRLPVKSSASDEMVLLFLLFNTCADHIHWIVPESDASGKSVAPTPWVQRYLQRWQKSVSNNDSAQARIPRGPAEQAFFLRQLEPECCRFLPPDFSIFIDPEIVRSFDSGGAYVHLAETRDLRRNGDPYWNGLIPAASARHWPADKTIAVTALESLSRCPFRFFAQSVARLEALEPLTFADRLSSLDWGKAVHLAMQVLLEPYVGGGVSLRQIGQRLLNDNQRGLREALQSLPGSLAVDLAMLPPLFRQATLGRILETVSSYLQSQLQEDCAEARPVKIEQKYRVPFPGLERLLVSGKIDRVDQKNGSLRVVDYKTGFQPSDLKKEIEMAFRLQAVLYPWLFGENESPQQPVEFSFVFLGDDPPKEAAGSKFSAPAALPFLESVRKVLMDGLFLPMSTPAIRQLGLENVQPCQYCECTSLCRRADRGATRRYAELFKTMAPERLRFLAEAGHLTSDDFPSRDHPAQGAPGTREAGPDHEAST